MISRGCLRSLRASARATRSSSRTRRNTGVSRMPSRIHNPTPTITMLSRNGMRQPQVRNWSPEIQLKISTAALARNSPAGAPNCGQEAMNPRCLLVRAHSIASSTEPPHSPPTPIPWISRKSQNDRTPDADSRRRPARVRPEAVAMPVISKVTISVALRPIGRRNGRMSPPRSAVQTNPIKKTPNAFSVSINGVRKPAKNTFPNTSPVIVPVDQKIVPLDRGADGAGDHRAAQMSRGVGFRHLAEGRVCRGHIVPPAI